MNLTPETIESKASTAIDKVTQSIKHSRRTSEDRIRKSPLPSVLGALGVGYFLRFLPITAILLAVLRLLLALVKPVIIAFGAFKLYEFVRSTAADNIGGTEPGRLPVPLDEPTGI